MLPKISGSKQALCFPRTHGLIVCCFVISVQCGDANAGELGSHANSQHYVSQITLQSLNGRNMHSVISCGNL